MSALPTDNMSDEEIEQLIALGIIPDQQNALQQQMAIAEKLRYGPGPQMRGEGGRVQTAAHPLEFIMQALQGRKAGKELDVLRQKNDELLQQQVKGRGVFFDRLRNRTRGPSQPPGITPSPDFEEGY